MEKKRENIGWPTNNFPRKTICSNLSAQISSSLDFHAIRVAGIVGQRNVLHLNDLDSLTNRASLHSKRDSFLLCLFQGLLTGEFVVVHQLFVSAADLGDSRADGIGATKVGGLQDRRSAAQLLRQDNGAAAN